MIRSSVGNCFCIKHANLVGFFSLFTLLAFSMKKCSFAYLSLSSNRATLPQQQPCPFGGTTLTAVELRVSLPVCSRVERLCLTELACLWLFASKACNVLHPARTKWKRDWRKDVLKQILFRLFYHNLEMFPLNVSFALILWRDVVLCQN